MIAISLDVDWAPDPIVDEIMDLVEQRGTPITLFCTDPSTDRSGKSSCLLGRYAARHELGLHPDFQATADYDSIWERLFQCYPGARGFRPHQGMSGWPIAATAARRGIVHETSTAIPPVFVPPFRPYPAALPEYRFVSTAFMDAQAFAREDFAWSLEELEFAPYLADPNRAFVFCFHPNILYYDVGTTQAYQEMKGWYHDPRPTRSFRHRPAEAAMKLFHQLLHVGDVSDFTTIINALELARS
jgi:hypothetical protein